MNQSTSPSTASPCVAVITERHVVTFLSPGLFLPGLSSKTIESWDPRLAVAMVRSERERPYGFLFSTVIDAEPIPDGRGGTLRVESKTINKSGFFFFGGTLETLDDVVRRNSPNESILVSNMKLGFPVVVVSPNHCGVPLPFTDRDAIVNDAGDVTARGDDPKWVAYRREIARRTMQ